MAVSAADVVKNILGVLGNLSAIGVLLAPAFTTFIEIVGDDGVGGRTCFPYALTWLNAVASVVHVWPQQDWWSIFVSTLTAAGETYYCYIYIVYSRGWNRVIAYIMAVVQLSFIMVLVVLEFTLFSHGHSPQAKEVLYGQFVAGTAVLMYLSPVRETAFAARTHDVDELSTLLSLAFLVNAVIGTASACFAPIDRFLLIANLAGIFSAAVQCIVWLIYRNPGQ